MCSSIQIDDVNWISQSAAGAIQTQTHTLRSIWCCLVKNETKWKFDKSNNNSLWWASECCLFHCGNSTFSKVVVLFRMRFDCWIVSHELIWYKCLFLCMDLISKEVVVRSFVVPVFPPISILPFISEVPEKFIDKYWFFLLYVRVIGCYLLAIFGWL